LSIANHFIQFFSIAMAVLSRQPSSRPGRGLDTGLWQILLPAGLLTIPMLTLSGLLLGLVFSHRVTNSPPQADEAAVYYVKFSATQLTTVASWSSTLTPLLPGLIMTLLFFPIASQIRSLSDARDMSRLPTPHQLNLLLCMSGGGFGAVWEWAKYIFWRRREKSVYAVRLSAAFLVISLLLG
jgi:hypothetical protein